MKHLGDITKLNGYDVEPVDVITGGSPCQDLSVAGKRAGLAGERSGLFMEQIRIIKEMRQRERDSGRSGVLVRPRYCVWENVPGAFSSNGGKDFQAVLTEFVKVCEPDAPDVPMPEKGKWPKAGVLYSDVGKWSIAYKLHDAQFWGVPQRRRRLCIVADFNGLTAGEILFDPQLRGEAEDTQPDETEPDPSGEPGREVSALSEGLSGNPEPGEPQGQETAGGTGQGTERADSASGFDGSMGAKAGNIGYEPEMAITTKSTGGANASFDVTEDEHRE